MLTVDIMTVLSCATSSEVEIPEISDWSEIKDCYVKWDIFHYTIDGEKWYEIALESEATECIDWKRPMETVIREVSENPEDRGKILFDSCE
jgi:hypothetical protein